MSKTEKSLKNRALMYLSHREMSQLELKRKLIPYAKNEEEIDTLLAEFADLNWQSDKRFTEAFINNKSRKHGSIRLKQELAAKGINADTIAEYLPDATIDLQHACEILRKKFKQPANNTLDKQKQIRFLVYRGFTFGVAQQAVCDAWLNDDE